MDSTEIGNGNGSLETMEIIAGMSYKNTRPLERSDMLVSVRMARLTLFTGQSPQKNLIMLICIIISAVATLRLEMVKMVLEILNVYD
jgi:hypothetical protein